MKKIASAMQMPKRSPRAVSADTFALSLNGPIRNATQMLAIIAERVALIEKKIPIAAPAKAAWDIVNPIEEIWTWVMITPRTAHAIDAKSIASTVRQTTMFVMMNSSMDIPRSTVSDHLFNTSWC